VSAHNLAAPRIAFPAILGTRVRLELASTTLAAATIEVDLVAVDAVGVYGCLVGLPGLVEFWPWHRINGAGAVRLQGELPEL
jgi:hypothetical protein